MAKPNPSRDELFQGAIDAHGHQFSRIARIYAGDDAEDLVQEMLLQIWRSLPKFRNDCAVGTWCYRVALNTALMYRRKVGRRREQSSGELDQQPAASSPTDQPQQNLLTQFLASLTDVDQAILLMHLANQATSEIAVALDMTEGAILRRKEFGWRFRRNLLLWEKLGPPLRFVFLFRQEHDTQARRPRVAAYRDQLSQAINHFLPPAFLPDSASGRISNGRLNACC